MFLKRNVSNNLNILLQAFRCIKYGGRFLVFHGVPRYRLLDNDNSLSGEQSLFRLVRRARCERNPPPGSRAAIFCHAWRVKRVTHNGLSERGTTRSLNQIKVITLANCKLHRQSSEPIKVRENVRERGDWMTKWREFYDAIVWRSNANQSK